MLLLDPKLVPIKKLRDEMSDFYSLFIYLVIIIIILIYHSLILIYFI